MIIALASPKVAVTLDDGLEKVRHALQNAAAQGAAVVGPEPQGIHVGRPHREAGQPQCDHLRAHALRNERVMLHRT